MQRLWRCGIKIGTNLSLFMETKGTAIKNLQGYLIEQLGQDKFKEFIDLLPEKSKEIHNGVILNTRWYDLKDSIIVPFRIYVEMINGDFDQEFYAVGKDSAQRNLSGIYRFFISVASVDFVIKRAAIIFSTYYNGGKIDIAKESNKIYLNVMGFDKSEEKIIINIAGWVEGVFDVIAKDKYKVEFLTEDLPENKILGKIISQRI